MIGTPLSMRPKLRRWNSVPLWPLLGVNATGVVSIIGAGV
jgi:hypothetical protein